MDLARMGRAAMEALPEMIDLHMHILPGVDDGAASMEDALEMARMAAAGGTEAVAATSHGNFSRSSLQEAREYLRFYGKRLKEFRRRLAEEQIPLKVCGGMELLAEEHLLSLAEEMRLPSLNGGKYLLVEFYFDIPRQMAESALERLQRLGWEVVLAHPERYDFVRREPECLLALYDARITLQVNAGSLSGQFGRHAFRAADYMLRSGIAGAVASDAHDPVLRTPVLEETAEYLDLHYGNGAAEVLLWRNPLRILRSR